MNKKKYFLKLGLFCLFWLGFYIVSENVFKVESNQYYALTGTFLGLWYAKVLDYLKQ